MQTIKKENTYLKLNNLVLIFLFSVIIETSQMMLQSLMYFFFQVLGLKDICPYISHRIPNDRL